MGNKLILIVLFLAGCGSNPGIKGDRGDPGLQGSQGARGPASSALQNSYKVTESLYCSQTISISGASHTFQYSMVEFNSAAKFVTCSVANSNNQYTNEVIYAESNSNYSDGICGLGFDLGGSTSGSWVFHEGSTYAKYASGIAGKPNDGFVMQFLASDCTN